MFSRQLLFRVMYRLGYTPWDGHPLAASLRSLVEGDGSSPPLSAATALDLGCGTGDTSIYLAKHGWRVTGVDFVSKPLDAARAKAAVERTPVNFVHADVTRLGSTGVGTGFALIVDNGCLHGMTDDERDGYTREVSAAAAPGARLLIVAFTPGATLAVRGIDQAEVERRLGADWSLLSVGDEPGMSGDGRFSARHYLLARRN
jgi:SAM-dependent methyltransferase